MRKCCIFWTTLEPKTIFIIIIQFTTTCDEEKHQGADITAETTETSHQLSELLSVIFFYRPTHKLFDSELFPF